MWRNGISQMSDVDIMLLGLTGSGKSASGNTIIGVKGTFKEDFSPVAVTRFCKSAQTLAYGQTISVIDTVGLSNTSVKITDAQTEIEKMLQDICSIEVFLLVIKLGQTFTEKDSKVVKWIQDNFGAKALKQTIVLFTHGDQLQGPVERYLRESETLRSVVDQCSGRYHVFNNRDKDSCQVTELLDKINKMMMLNRNSTYITQDYRDTQADLLLKKCFTLAAGAAVVSMMASAALTGTEAAAIAALGALGGAALAAVAFVIRVLYWANKKMYNIF